MGQKYASYNDSGAVIAYYDSVDSPPPSTATVIDITDSQWQAALASPYPVTVANGALVIPTGPTLAQAQAAQSALIKQGYLAALNTPVTFTNAAGVTSTYAFGNTLTAGGSNAQQLLASIVAAGSAAWKAGVWFDTNGVAQIMTFADLQNLAEAVEAQETPDEQDLMSLLAQIAAATTVSAVQAIVW